MAIQKEIWQQSIVEGLFAPNSFLSKAVNADEYVNAGKVVHIPQAGKASSVTKNRSTVPAKATMRNDTDINFTLNEYTTDPIIIPHADTVELSYDKRASVLRQDKLALFDAVALDFLHDWSPAAANVIETSGAVVAAHTPSATGNRKAVTKADVLSLMTAFNATNIPQEGRYLMLDAYMYAQLLNDLTANENSAFLASADAQRGVLGQLHSFNIMMRSRVTLYAAAKTVKTWSEAGAATDCAAALAWHEQSVCRALGEVVAFENEDDATYYGSVYSFLVRAGGRIMRSDNKGVMALMQAAAE